MENTKKVKQTIVLLIVILFSLGVCTYIIKSVYDNGTITAVYDESRTRTSKEIISGEKLEQVISLPDTAIKGFAFNVDFAHETLIGDRVILSVFDNETKELLASREQSTGNFFENELVRFKFPYEIAPTDNKLLVTIQFGEIDFDGGLFMDFVDGNADILVISKSTDPYFVIVIYIFVLLILMIISVFLILYFAKKKIGLEWAYLPVGIAMGLIFLVLIPVMEVPDEAGHLYSAYHGSNTILGIEESADTSIRMRAADASFYFQNFDVDRRYMDGIYSGLFSGIEDSRIVDTDFYQSSSQMYLYLPSTIGITIGRILGCSTMLTYILGRLFNIIVFIAAVWYAIRRMPFGKTLVAIWAIIPTTLQQTASISRDSVIFALCIIVISLTLHLKYHSERDVHFKRKAIFLAACALVLLPAKSFACMMVSLFPLLLVAPFVVELFAKKTKTIPKARMIAFGTIVVFVILAAGFAVFSKALGIMVPGMSVGRLVKLLINTAVIQGDNYLFGLLGANLGWLDVKINKYYVLPLLICLVIAAFRAKESGTMLSAPIKIWMLLVFVGTALIPILGMLSAWTPDGYNYIEGVQGRHFIPALVLLFLPLRGKRVTIDEVVEKNLFMISAFCELMVVTGVVLSQI